MRNKKTVSLGVVLLGLTLFGGPSFAEAENSQIQLQGNVLGYTDDNGMMKLLTLPCAGSASIEHESLVLVACGEEGLLVVGPGTDGSLSVLRQHDLKKSVDGLFLGEGAVWARTGESNAWPVDASLWEGLGSKEVKMPPSPERLDVRAVSPPPSPLVHIEPVKTIEPEGGAVWIGPSAGKASLTSGPAAVLEIGTVTENRGETVVVDFGSLLGVEKGRHVELFMESGVTLGGESKGTREESIAVGYVVAVTENHCEVRLGVNEWVPEGSRARITSQRTTDGIWARPRIGGVSELGFTLRPYIGLERFAAGTVSNLDFNYRFEAPVRLRILVDPLGLGFTDNGFIVSAAANIIATFDADLYEIGLGVGWTIINDDPRNFYDEATSDDYGEMNSGLSLAQYARFGAEEGFNITVYNSFVLYDEAFYYGGSSGTIQFPLGTYGRPLWIFLRGGGGVAGYAFGEIGLRILAIGNGGPDSIFLSPSIGYAGIGGNQENCEDYGTASEYCYYSDDYFTGPMVGFGVQWRF